MMIKYISAFMAFLQVFLFTCFKSYCYQTIGVNKHVKYQQIETFGTSSAWWAQKIDDDATAKEIARRLYDDETGLGLDIFRYNIGAGEKENPDSRIGDVNRRTESFYVLNPETGEYEYDFSRDANARRVLDYAVEYGASKVILFCNSPHFSMTASGHASGALTDYTSNHPKEKYAEFVDYVLTIADWFVAQGYPVSAISPINEPMWTWGGGWVGQEGCHYTADETVELLEMFALEMQKRNSPYELSGPESGQLTHEYYEYIDKFLASPILSDCCNSVAAHSYWIDNNIGAKQAFGQKMAEQYPDVKFEMSEWCEIPLKIDSLTIDSGLHMANVILQDLKYMNAVSWQSWTAVNGDGLMDLIDGELVTFNRYYAYMQFCRFIEPGMYRIDVLDSLKEDSLIESIAFADDEKTVIILINNTEEDKPIKLHGLYKSQSVYRTDRANNCTEIYSGIARRSLEIPAKSITTVVYENL